MCDFHDILGPFDPCYKNATELFKSILMTIACLVLVAESHFLFSMFVCFNQYISLRCNALQIKFRILIHKMDHQPSIFLQ